MNCYENFIVNNFLFFTTFQLGLDGLPADPSRSGPWFQFLMLLVQSKTARDFFNYLVFVRVGLVHFFVRDRSWSVGLCTRIILVS